MFSNNDIRQYSTGLFAHTPAYNEPEIFTGREREQEEILSWIGEVNGNGQVALAVTAPLGSGKTFLLQFLLTQLEDKGVVSPEERRDAIQSIRTLTPDIVEALDGIRLIVIDEVDRKERRKTLVEKLTAISGAIRDSFPYVVLCGDESLTDTDAWSHVLGAEIRLPVTRLQPLDPDFLLDALKKRALYSPDTRANAAAIPDLFDPDVLRCLLPPTRPNVATFRDVLAVLMRIATDDWGLPFDEEPCRISAEVCREWSENMASQTDDANQLTFLRWLGGRMSESLKTGKTLEALTTQACIAGCPIPGVRTPAEYEAAILAPLVKAEVLTSYGVPSLEELGLRARFPPPYLPSVETWLRATYDRRWP